MNFKRKSKPLFWFYLLVVYIVIQFVWWSYLMIELSNEVYYLKTHLNLLQGESSKEIALKGNELNETLKIKWLMITSEGSVFVGILLFGILQIRKSFTKEAALTQQQNNFLLSVTHELKSPIASTKLQLQTLEKRELDRAKQKEIIQNAIHDTDRLKTLVDNILLAAKIENKAYTLHTERTNISELVTHIIQQHAISFHHRHNIKLAVTPDIFMNVDPVGFPSIVLNLFENALNYSPVDSIITITLKENQEKLLFSISDEGVGIPHTEKKKIFQKFYRVGNEEIRKTKGTGLGLHITDFLVKQHKGSITVKDNHPKGSIFEITFIKGIV